MRGGSNHYPPEELFPRWRGYDFGAAALGNNWNDLGAMHDTICEPTCLVFKEKHKNNKKPNTWRARTHTRTLTHIHAPQQFIRILAADTIPYLPLKMGIKQKQIAHAYIYDQLLKNYHEA